MSYAQLGKKKLMLDFAVRHERVLATWGWRWAGERVVPKGSQSKRAAEFKEGKKPCPAVHL